MKWGGFCLANCYPQESEREKEKGKSKRKKYGAISKRYHSHIFDREKSKKKLKEK